jgi:outer membrane protein insertion porin family
VRTGGSLRAGFPVPNSPFTRLGVSYSGEVTDFGERGETEDIRRLYGNNPFRSTLGLDLTHDTRVDLPFATAGGQQLATAQFNGGPLGGNASFQRYTAELRSYAPLGSVGGGRPGSQPIKFVLGLTGRAGALFGDPGPFYQFQSFTLGGVQFGEQLRGYPETCVTPQGVQPTRGSESCVSSRGSFGNSFITLTGELGMRVNPSLYLSTFYDAGNVFARVSDFNPTRLVRGAGFGVSVITPLGPLGLDYAYGFDRVVIDANGLVRSAPKWQLHFRLGQLF